jgi:hypothetical protein
MTDSISRVRYYDQQILRTSDFVDEQAYHLAQRRRHNIGAHIWGIVSGLELALDANGALGVQPGMAIDGYGRELILEQYRPIDPRIFDEKGSETLDVYLEYVQETTQDAPRGYIACRDPASSDNRVREAAGVSFRKPGAPPLLAGIDLPERRQPEEVPEDDWRFPPERTAPDSPGRRWPVFLGQLRRGGDPPVSLDGRPYAGLRGEMVRAGSGWAWLQVGEWPDNEYRFAVFLAEGDQDTQGAVPEAPPPAPPEPIFGISPIKPPDGKRPPDDSDAGKAAAAGPTIELRANTLLQGDLLIDGGAISFGVGPAYDGPKPWRIYHAFQEPNDENEEAVAENQLRIEMAGPSSEVVNEVVVGHWSTQKQAFQPYLTIADDGKVTAHRNLVVNGKVSGDVEVLHLPPETPRAMVEQAEDRRFLRRLVRNPSRLRALNERIRRDPAARDAFAEAVAPRYPSGEPAAVPDDELLWQIVERASTSPEQLQELNSTFQKYLAAAMTAVAPPPAAALGGLLEADPDAPASPEQLQELNRAFQKYLAAAMAAMAPPAEAAPGGLLEADPDAPAAVAPAEPVEAAPAETPPQAGEVTDAELRRFAFQLHRDTDLRKRFAAATQPTQQALRAAWKGRPQAKPNQLAAEDETPQMLPADAERIIDQIAQNPDLQARLAPLTTKVVRQSLGEQWRSLGPDPAPADGGDVGDTPEAG